MLHQAVRAFVGYQVPQWATAAHVLATIFIAGLSLVVAHFWPQTRLWTLRESKLIEADFVHAEVRDLSLIHAL